MMRVSLGPVRMSVTDFLRIRFANREDLHVEGQINASERMIAIEQHLVAFDRRDRHHRIRTMRPRLKLVADVQLTFNRQHTAAHLLHLGGIAFAVGFLSRDLHPDFGARGGSPKLFIESIDDLARTLQIRDWLDSG